MSVPSKAKINRKLATRAIIFVVVMGAVLYGYLWLQNTGGDIDRTRAAYQSAGQIAAIESVEGGGDQAVLVSQDGTITPAPDYKPGEEDRNIIWRSDGGRVLFESDRYNQEPHIFRWNPDTKAVDRLSLDKRGKGKMSFEVPITGPSKTALLIEGGTVLDFDPVTGNTLQLLPPRNKNAAQGTSQEEGGKSDMESLYAQYGNSFVNAMWLKDKKYVAAVLQRDAGQVLILQDITALKPPIPIASGDKIDIDVNPKDGELVYVVQGYQVPDWDPEAVKRFTKNGRIIPPYKHIIAAVDPDKQTGMRIGLSNDDKVVFGAPKVSPDGSSLLLTVGSLAQGDYTVRGFAVVPFAQDGAQHPRNFPIPGVKHPSWDPTGQKILFIARSKTGTDDIFLAEADGSNGKDITNGKGSFTEAVMSPQIKSQ